MSDIDEYAASELEEHLVVLSATKALIIERFPRLARACGEAVRAGHRLFFFGNGGSAADAQHLAAELVVRYRASRSAISATALTTDTSVMTAIGNDLGFDDLFARQLEAHCRAGDVAIGISTSGNSENVLRGLRTARALGAVTIGLTGGTGGEIVRCVDIAVVIPSVTTARVQEMHILVGHMLCGVLERQVAGGA